MAVWSAGIIAAAQTGQEQFAAIRKRIREAPTFDFGKVRAGDPVEHTFEFRNSANERLEVKSIQLTPPLTVTKVSRFIDPGATAGLTVRLSEPRSPGDFEGLIVVQFTSGNAPHALFRVQGRIVGSIDFEPMRAFFVTAFKGESAEQSLRITNYSARPLEIVKVEHDGTRFTTDLETTQSGRSYRLTLRTNPDAPAGRSQDAIRLFTSDERHPVIQVPANVQVRERVYSFPDSVSFGMLDPADLGSNAVDAEFFKRVVTIYQRNGTDFRIDASSDLPFLRLTKRQAHLKDRYELSVEVVPEGLKPGAFAGTIRIETNDAGFPALEIPVAGRVKAE